MALPQNPRHMIPGRIFSEMIRIQAQKQAKSRSYKLADPENRPEKELEWGLGASAEPPPLKPS